MPLTYSDAVADENSYVAWLCDTCDGPELAERIVQIMRDGGYATGQGMVDVLAAGPKVDLADWLAVNTPFDTDDDEWLEHCADVYPIYPHASLTTDDREGVHASWEVAV